MEEEEEEDERRRREARQRGEARQAWGGSGSGRAGWQEGHTGNLCGTGKASIMANVTEGGGRLPSPNGSATAIVMVPRKQ